MIIIRQESPCSPEAIRLLKKSCEHVLGVQDDFNHTYKLDILSSNQARFFVVRNDNLAIGCGCYVHLTDDTVEIKHIYLNESSRGSGCGKELLLHIEKIAKWDNVKTIVLETVVDMEAAYAMYQKFGYEQCEPYVLHPLHDSIYMYKNL